jgi:amidase
VLDRDMAVIGPMARSAADLALALDVIAGLDPLETGIGYKLALPPPRHDTLRDFRVLVVDGHPLLPANDEVRAGIARLASDLESIGANVVRQSPLLPDFAEASRLYMRMLMAFLASFWPAEQYDAMRAVAAQLRPDDTSLAAERLRGATTSHRPWVLDEGVRARLRAQWRELFRNFDAVICPIMPTQAYLHDHSPEQEKRRVNIDGKDYVYPDQLSWPGFATLPGLPATAIPTGFASDGLPIGVQILGPWLEDRTPIKLAELIEREFGGFVPPPMFDD